MASEKSQRLAILLENYYAAEATDLQASGRLEEAIVEELDPFILRQIRAERFSDADTQDMCQDARIKSVNALRRSRDTKNPILHLPGLVSTIVCRLIDEEVRRTAPEYCMKRDVRHLVTQSPLKTLLARWQWEAEWLIGLMQWQGEPFQRTPEYAAFCGDDTTFVQEGLEGCNPANHRQVRLPELLLKFLKWVQTPLEEINLVAHLLSLRANMPRNTVSLQQLAGEGNEKWLAAPDAEKDSEELKGQWNWEVWWQALCKLPVPARAYILLAREPEELKFMTGLTLPCARLAAALEIDPDEMERLWKQLPLPEETIADRYGKTVNAMQRMRSYYLEQLRKRPGMPPPL